MIRLIPKPVFESTVVVIKQPLPDLEKLKIPKDVYEKIDDIEKLKRLGVKK